MAEEKTRTIVKRVENAILYSDGSIRLDNCRASHPHLVTPQLQTNDDGKETSSYTLQLLMPKKTHKAAKNLCVEVLKGILTDNKLKDVPADKKFIKDGDTLAKEELEGQWVVGTREGKNPPSLRGAKRDPKTGKPMRIDPAKDGGVFYGGCYVSALVRPWFSVHPKGGKRVSCGLLAVQFLRDGEPFGTGRIKEDDIDDSFEAAEPDDDDSGMDDDDTGGL